MKELAEQILDYIMENREVPEDLLYEFSKETLRIIQSRQTTSIPDTFWDLENYVETFWRCSEFTQAENSYFVHQMGQLLSFTNLISIMDDEEQRELSIEDYAEQWRDRYLVFDYIHRHRGITHKTLAEASGMSVSALSQFINKVKWTGVFNCRSMGREKHYYLTEYGEQVYEYMKKNAEKKKLGRSRLTEWEVEEDRLGGYKLYGKFKIDNNEIDDNVRDSGIRKEKSSGNDDVLDMKWPEYKFRTFLDIKNEEKTYV